MQFIDYDKSNFFKLNPNANIFIPQGKYRKAIIPNKTNPNSMLANFHVSQSLTKNVNLDQHQSDEFNNSVNFSNLNEIRVKNHDKVIIGHLNINSIRNKIEELANLVMGMVDILLISESKIDDSFPESQFLIPGFSIPYRKDRDSRGGGIILYIRQDIPSKLLSNSHSPFETKYENLFVEINLHKRKWLIGGSYNPTKTMIQEHTKYLSKCLDYFSASYENMIILGDFNSEPWEPAISNLCDTYNLKKLIKVPTCFKNPLNPSCIDLILTNRSRSFQNSAAIETGISDFHKMVVTVLKTSFKKGPPKVISYRDYRNFTYSDFRRDLEARFSINDLCIMSNDKFVEEFMIILEIHAPVKQKVLRCNHSPFITKVIRKEIMKRTLLRNRFLKCKSLVSKNLYNKQRNYCTHLIKKAKKDYYSKLHPSCVASSKKFWKAVKPLFTDKILTGDNIVLIENQQIISDKDKIAEIFNIFFSNAVQSLGIVTDNMGAIISDDDFSDPILGAINKYNDHPSIIKIKQVTSNKNNFSFSHTNIEAVESEIQSLDIRSSCPISNIPPKVIKENLDIFSIKLYKDFNQALDDKIFPENCKLADITPAHKKSNKMDKSNYRPVSTLPAIAKIFERLLYYQLANYFDDKLSKVQCGFRKGYSAQYCLIVMLEKWRKAMDMQSSAGALLSDLSKAFDCLNHELMIAKLHAYGCDFNSLKLINSYLQNRFHRVKVNSAYSSWSSIISGIPQGSILGPLLFNIYLCDLFLFFEDSNIASYADDTTPYTYMDNMELVLAKLEEDSVILIDWINNNYLKANPDKFHILLSDKDETFAINVDKHKIFNRGSENLLGITIDSKLSFDEHVSKLCKTASQKLHALARVARYMDTAKRKIIMNAFISSQFSYCPLVWMLHSRKLNNRINKIHERALKIVYGDHNATYEELLARDGSVTIHERNIQTLAIEMYKVVNGYSPEIIQETFKLKERDIYCTKFPFSTRNVKTDSYGIQSLGFLGPKIWSIIPDNLKQLSSLNHFKNQIKKWKPIDCPCRLCKTYIYGVGFVD